jgi:hypothetical protein
MKKDSVVMQHDSLLKLADKSLTKEELFREVERNPDLIPILLGGISSQKATIRYGCAKVLVDLSVKYPERLYPYMDFFVNLLDSKYRILTWNAMAIIANLASVDKNKKFDVIFDKYYGFVNDEYMVTVANVVGNSAKIALAKPHLVQKITNELLKVENIAITPHLTEECRRVIAEKTIEAFDVFFDRIEAKAKVISFVRQQLDSPRSALRTEAERFLKKWNR